MRYCLLVALLLILSVISPAHAWNHTGHVVTAWVAWDAMTPETRSKVTEILKAHPNYERDLLVDMPESYDQPDRWAFGRAATWPDVIRNRQHPLHNQHRGNWHYINLPVVAPGYEPTLPTPQGNEPREVLQAIEHNRRELLEATTPEGKAIALAWLLHLVGDVHQPLHAVAFFSPQFPKGDKGGNDFLVTREAGNESNLHELWDGILGGYREPALVEQVVVKVKEQPVEEAALQLTDPTGWAEESRKAAEEIAYANAKLRGLNHADRPKGSTEPKAPPLPAGYEDRARDMARQRCNLAGQRLARLLGQLLR